MALAGPRTSNSGVVCQYHRIIQLSHVNFRSSEMSFKVAMYLTQVARNTGKSPVQTLSINYAFAKPLPDEDIRNMLYTHLKTLPANGNLVDA
jgi:hypothetical protein